VKRPDVKAKRESWFNAQPDLDPDRLVFIDETGVSTNPSRLSQNNQPNVKINPSGVISPTVKRRNDLLFILIGKQHRKTHCYCLGYFTMELSL
jgi:hypothetical protein